MLKFCLCVSFLAVLSITANAQDAQQDDEYIICTTHRQLWLGTTSEIQNIQSDPIPMSFRQIFETKGCINTARQDLIMWHRNYGSQATMTEALKYLEKSVKTQGIGMIPRAKGARITSEHKTEDYARIAWHYNLAAKAFPSLDFVKSAERIEKKTKTLCDKLASDRLKHSWASGCRLDGYLSVIEKLSRETAVTRALITGEMSDVESAQAILARSKIPAMDKFIENATESFEGLCSQNDIEKDIQSACVAGYTDEDVRKVLTLQTLLATIEDRHSNESFPEKSYELFAGLFPMLMVAEAHQLGVHTVLAPSEFAEERVRLSLAFSDMHFRLAQKQLKKGTNKNYKIAGDVADNMRHSLDHLLAAEKYTPRYKSPSQWNRIAVKFVVRMEVWKQMDSEVRDQMEWPSERDRQLEYFKGGL